MLDIKITVVIDDSALLMVIDYNKWLRFVQHNSKSSSCFIPINVVNSE